MPLSLHTLTGRTKAAQQDESDIGELYARMVIRTHETQHSLRTLIFSGVFERFPGLKIVSAENDIAWGPSIRSSVPTSTTAGSSRPMAVCCR